MGLSNRVAVIPFRKLIGDRLYVFRVEQADITAYKIRWFGKTAFAHRLTIQGLEYSFFAHWGKQFVYKNEKASFKWGWDNSGIYRNINPRSIVAIALDGKQIYRGRHWSQHGSIKFHERDWKSGVHSSGAQE